jgi:hypothetical protein
MVTPQQMSMRGASRQHGSVKWQIQSGELLEYKHLIANPKTQAKWTHSYGNNIGCLAQGMPGCNTSTNTIIFIRKDQVPKGRAKDVTYGLITCLV